MAQQTYLSSSEFASFLNHQGPKYAEDIDKDIRIHDSAWYTFMDRAGYNPFMGSEMYGDRYHHVAPDLSAPWEKYDPQNCTTNPCDYNEHEIGMGYSRYKYGLERISYRSPMFCYEQSLTRSRAKEHIAQYKDDILKPATLDISSQFLRRKYIEHAGTLYMCGADFGSPSSKFTMQWQILNGQQTIMKVTSGATTPTSLLTSEMLMRRYHEQILLGALGKNPHGSGKMLEICTGLEECWELNRNLTHVGTGAQVMQINDRWRYQDIVDGPAEWAKFGWTGRIGNFGVMVDVAPLRFDKIGADTYQLVPKYINVDNTYRDSAGNTVLQPADATPWSSGGLVPNMNQLAGNWESGYPGDYGLRSIPNPAYQTANYQFTLLRHKGAMQWLTFHDAALHPDMNFMRRNFAGNWMFVTNDLGVPNERKNKGRWIGDFYYGIRPRQIEFAEGYFHQRRAIEVTAVDISPTERNVPYDWNSSMRTCAPGTNSFEFNAAIGVDGTPNVGTTIDQNTGVVIDGTVQVLAGDIVGEVAQTASLATDINGVITMLATKLNDNAQSNATVAAAGTWANDNGSLVLTGSTHTSVTINFTPHTA